MQPDDCQTDGLADEPSERVLTAHHEAAHAVVGHAAGLQVTSADIVLVPGVRRGVVHFVNHDWVAMGADRTAPRVVHDARQHAVASWAGRLADERFQGIDGVTSSPLSMKKIEALASQIRDFDMVLTAAHLFLAGEQLDFIERSRAIALLFLDENWSTIELLAAELLTHESLDGAAVRRVIAGAVA